MGMGCTRVLDRVAAALGGLQEAPVEFEAVEDVPCGGVLWALPALEANGLLRHTRKYFQLPKGFYSVVNIFLLLACLALARIKSAEGLRYCPPGEWGKLLGLDRIPEVRTLRAKLGHLSQEEKAGQWSAQLSQEWMEADPELAGLLYVDGHVRVYHGGQTRLPKRYVARQRLCLRGTTDYWVNDREGRPFFVVPAAVTPGLIEMMRNEIVPRLLEEVPHQPCTQELEADPYRHRFVVIFDREGYSPAWMKELWQQRIACHTYRKYPGEDWAASEFSQQTVRGPRGEAAPMQLAERGTWLGEKLWVREIRKLTETGHQTAIISTDFQSATPQIAMQMFSRWSQENYFKYMTEHYNLDRLVEYQTEPLAETTRVVNPTHRQLEGQIKSQAAKLSRKKAQFGALMLEGELEVSPVEDYQKRQADLQETIELCEKDLEALKQQRRGLSRHITLAELPEKERFAQLAGGRKHLLDTIKMIAYRAETAMAALLRPSMSRTEEARSLLREIFTTEADLLPDEKAGTLTVSLHHLANASSDHLAQELSQQLNASDTVFPGTNLRLIYKLVSC
jgi:hypothetical protein